MIAIIPARCGSKGFKSKNIQELKGIPLIGHSINFAKKLSFISKIYVLTDSLQYAKIAIQLGAEIPYLRKENSSNDLSMEEDILEELRLNNIVDQSAEILWLRPTHPLRPVDLFEEGYKKFKTQKYSSICMVTNAETRIYYDEKSFLKPIDNKLSSKSMWRRQDVIKGYKLYHGEFFRMPTEYNVSFLGHQIGYIELPNLCAFDIDDKIDLEYLEYRIQNLNNYERFVHAD